MHVLVDHRHDVVALERRPTGQHHRQDATEGIDVTAFIGRATQDLLRRQVGGTAHHRVRLRQAGSRGMGQPGDPEVDDLHRVGPVEHHVRRLDVTVDHPGRMGSGQPSRDLLGQPDHLGLRQFTVFGHVRRERGAGEQLHDQERRVPVDARVEDGDHVRVSYARRGPGLPPEALEVLARPACDTLDLDRDLAAQQLVAGGPDLPHPAGPDGAFQPIPSCQQCPGLHESYPVRAWNTVDPLFH